MAEFSDHDIQQLQRAKGYLQSTSLMMQVSDLIGAPIEKGMLLLPENVKEKLNEVTEKALMKAIDAAIYTLQDAPGSVASHNLHKLGVAASGGLGGFFGLSAIAVELPVSTSIILRSIADIARSEGESVKSLETKMACLEVFALGGPQQGDDGAETSYFTIRSALAKSITDATEYIAQKGFSDKTAPVLIKLISKIAERFGIQVSQKAAAQAIPAIGAAGGAIINTLFIDHFQNIARGHFIIRRLERSHGKQAVQAMYLSLPD
ncbi:MAG: EcsC family protein [Pseudomonadales bacterium]|nr:EcsC family protein [Pseudomonadales bacterium]